MGQFFGQETLTEIIRVDNSTVRLPSGSYIRLGGQAYRLNTNLDLDTGTVGAGGLESAVQANTFYYVYAVFDSSDVKLIGSTSKMMPSGYSSYRKVGAFLTDDSSNVLNAYFLGIAGDKTITKKLDLNLEGNDGRAITGGSEDVHFSGSGQGWVSVGNDNHYKVQYENSTIHLTGCIAHNNLPTMTYYLYLNDTFYRTINRDSTSSNSVGTGNFIYLSKEGEFSVGDELSIRQNRSISLSNVVTNHYLNIRETKQFN